MSFEAIIGNNKIKKELEEIVRSENISHSYMFCGIDGIGKHIFAREFAKMILCVSENKGCNTCNSCIMFCSGNNPDFLELEPDGNSIKISQIREIQEYIYQKPIVSNKKVLIINNCEKMTEEAQNSLLKTLEEPPEYMVIILVTSNENKLLNTIKSRCIKLSFQGLSTEELNQYIKTNTKLVMPNKSILNLCNGSLGRLLEICENIEAYNQLENAINNLLLGKITSVANVFTEFEVLYKSKDIIAQLLDYAMSVIYESIKTSEAYSEKYLNLIFEIEKTKNRLNANCNYDMSIDGLLMKMFETRKEGKI